MLNTTKKSLVFVLFEKPFSDVCGLGIKTLRYRRSEGGQGGHKNAESTASLIMFGFMFLIVSFPTNWGTARVLVMIKVDIE